MLYIASLIVGFGLGWFVAGKRGGNTADKLQYGVVFGMIAMVLTLIVLMVLVSVLN